MVVDMKKYNPGKPIQSDTLWILEQVPGFTERYQKFHRNFIFNKNFSADVSKVLHDQSYWASYNVK